MHLTEREDKEKKTEDEELPEDFSTERQVMYDSRKEADTKIIITATKGNVKITKFRRKTPAKRKRTKRKVIKATRRRPRIRM